MIVSSVPIFVIDVAGSLLVMIISLFALHKSWMLRRQDPSNFVYLYLLWICVGFVVFAVSRSSGHVLKQMLVLLHNHSEWVKICPFTGMINTVTFMLVGMITLFFEQSWNINIRINASRKRLEEAHAEVLNMNQTLEQKVLERTEQMTNTEHKCRRVFEQSRDIILLTDASFHIIETNPAGLDMSGYSRDEMIKRKMSLSQFFVSSAEWLRMRALIHDNEFIVNEETEFIRSDGQHLAVIITGGMDYGAFGGQTTYHFIIKNIDNKRKLEKRLIQTEKLAALGQLSAGVAHEINNPLGVILGYTQLMLKRKSLDVPPEIYEDLNTIKKHVLTCTSVVSDLLTFSRKDSPEMSLFDINDLVRDVIGLFSNHLDFKEIELNQDLSGQADLSVKGNDQEIRQVIINLLINAGHAIEKNGIIELKTWKEASKVYLLVKDNGCGIEEGDLVKIFDPFFTTKPVGQGTGLGLSVSYGIINNHRGEISVKSVPAEGTEFLVMLPAAA